MSHPNASHSITLRVDLPQRPGSFGQLATVIGEQGGILGAIDLVKTGKDFVTRDVTVACSDEAQADAIIAACGNIEGVVVRSASDRTFRIF